MIMSAIGSFGWLGLLSVLTSCFVMVMCWGCAFHKDRTVLAFIGFCFSILALITANGLSSFVSNIRPDRTALLQEASAMQKDLREKYGDDSMIAMRSRYAEDNPRDTTETITPDEGLPTSSNESTVPAYKLKGKQLRDGSSASSNDQAVLTTNEENDGPMLPESDLIFVNKLDQWNLNWCRAMVWLSLITCIIFYCREFNSPHAPRLPLPLASPWIDAVSNKPFEWRMKAENQRDVANFLEKAVLKGETFLWLNPSDPWDQDALPRLKLGHLTLRKLERVKELAMPDDVEWLFESLWFGRLCAVVLNKEHGGEWLGYIYYHLQARYATRAKCFSSVWIVCKPLDFEFNDDFLIAFKKHSSSAGFRWLILE